MNATSALLCLTVSLTTLAFQHECLAAAQSDAGSAPTPHQRAEKSGAAAKTDPGGMPPAAKPKQFPAPRDPSQAVEERLRSGQMDKPIAQGEVSDRLNHLYSGSNHLAGDTAAEHPTR
jgi:hypothetical protein